MTYETHYILDILTCFIIFIILLVVYDVSLAKQSFDKYARNQKEFATIFLLEYLQLLVSTYISKLKEINVSYQLTFIRVFYHL